MDLAVLTDEELRKIGARLGLSGEVDAQAVLDRMKVFTDITNANNQRISRREIRLGIDTGQTDVLLITPPKRLENQDQSGWAYATYRTSDEIERKANAPQPKEYSVWDLIDESEMASYLLGVTKPSSTTLIMMGQAATQLGINANLLSDIQAGVASKYQAAHTLTSS